MKQILQSLKTGDSYLTDIPPPAIQNGRILVRTACSLISAGTDRATSNLGKKNLLGKARERPELVKKVFQKIKDEGLFNTLTTIREKLDSGIAPGYSAAGIITAIGDGVIGFQVGDRVACAGVGFASHAEVISVPQNLSVRLPDQVGFEEGAFGTLGAIALQGVRLANPTLGEAVVVIGLGLLGQITVQLLKANGCRVFGVDVDKNKFELAKTFGAENCSTPDEARDLINEWSRGRGADAVLITAATESNAPVELAGEISRLKGRVVVVGLVGMKIPRPSYFQKELSLQISMSYGPGRYDAEYEERGHDYPVGYVRWTEGRNIEAFLDLIAAGSLNLRKLITHQFPIEQASNAYKLISGESKEFFLGIVLNYDTAKEIPTKITLRKTLSKSSNAVRLGLIGAGGYTRKFLLPNFKANKVDFCSIATASGLSAREVGNQYSFSSCVSSGEEVIEDENANLIVIATRHDSHARFVQKALKRNKYVFVEKPLAINDKELDEIIVAAKNSDGNLMVGYNRRFSLPAKQAKDFFAETLSPLSINYRINAGRIPRKDWVQDPSQGGRIIGEVCHFIDFMQFMTNSIPIRVFAETIKTNNEEMIEEDSVFITLKFSDGSNGVIAYLAEGSKALPKERIEIFGGGQSVTIDDFRSISIYKNGNDTTTRLRYQDKGQKEEINLICSTILDGKSFPITLEELIVTSRTTFRVIDSIKTGQVITV